MGDAADLHPLQQVRERNRWELDNRAPALPLLLALLALHSHSGPLSPAAVQAMASSSFTVLEKYQSLLAPPVRAGGELKVIDAALQIRSAAANSTLIFYFAVDCE